MAGLLDGIAGIAGTAQRTAQQAARKKPAKRKAPARRAPVAPRRDIVRDAAASTFGTATGAIRSAARGDTPAQTRRAVKRDVQANRRSASIRDYLDAPRAERSKQAAAAEKRVAAGSASTKDKLIVQTHERRTKNDAGRSRSAVKAANEAHDRAVARERVADLVAGLGKTGRGTASKSDGGILGKLAKDAKNAPGDIAEFAGAAGKTGANAAADVALAGSEGIKKLSEVRLTGRESDKNKALRGGIDPGGAAKAIAIPVATSANIVKVSADDPSQIPRALKDVAGMVKDIPAGIVQSVSDPKKAVRDTFADYKRRYSGTNEEIRARMKKEGFAPELVDVVGLASGESTGAARAVSATAKATAKTTKAGSRANRAANRVDRFVNAPRPDLVKTENVAVPQRKSKGIVGIAAQRTIDSRRRARVSREATEALAARGKLPPAVTKRQARANARLERKVERPGAGEGIRGVVPKEGQVAARFPKSRDRRVRKQTAVVASLGFRRGERLQNELTRPAERAFRALSKLEQRAAVHALEGTINPKDPAATVRAIDRRLKAVKTERNRMRAEEPQKWETEYLPLMGKESSDEVVQLEKLRASVVATPGKVLTERLQAFVAGEQKRRPRADQVAGDSLRPSTIEARRFAPVGELVGTRDAYVPRAAALGRLETRTPAAALQDIGAELRKVRASKGGKRKATALQAEARAVQSITRSRPQNKRMTAGELDAARTAEAATFRERTQAVAAAQGLGTPDPVFVKHKKRPTSFAGSRSTGGGEHGAVVGPRKSELALFRRGFRDTSDAAYAGGLQESAKRSVQWRMVNELVQDQVPSWSRGASGNGITRREAELLTVKRNLDPKDWVAWRAGREEVDPDADVPGDAEAITPEDAAPLSDITNVKWATTDKFFLIPMAAFNEMKRGHGGGDSISRVGSRITGVQSQMILGSNPAYGVRQVLQTAPLTGVSVGKEAFDPVFWNNLKAYRRTRKLDPEVWNDVLDILGVRSKSADAVRSVKRGDALDVKRFEGALVHTWGGMFGAAARDYLVSPRKSPSAAGTASQVARTAAKTALTPFRMIRDVNMAIDAHQDRWARTVALAAQDARMRKGDAERFGNTIAAAMADNTKRLGPLAATLELPAKQRDAFSRTAEFRRMGEQAADGFIRMLGDYANYTQLEQKVGRAFVPFYGFARHSTRLLVYTLPLEHPFTFAAVLSMSGIQAREKEQMLRDYMKKIGREGEIPAMLDGLILTADGGGKLETVDARWLNPLTGPVFEALSSDPVTATSGVQTPLVKGILETMFETNAFSKSKLSNADGQVGPANPLSALDKGRVIANRVMGSMFPFRAWNDLVNGEKGKLTDTSLPFDGQPYPYKPTSTGKLSAAGEKNAQKVRDQRAQGPKERVLDSVVPGRRKPITSLLNAAEYAGDLAGKKKPKKKRPASKSTSTFGTGGGGF